MTGWLIGGTACLWIGLGLFHYTYANQGSIKYKHYDGDQIEYLFMFVATVLCGCGTLAMIMSGLYLFLN